MWLFACLVMLAFLQGVGVGGSHAQVTTAITPDGTMGTAITQTANIFDIAGGTIRGANQFHSFDRFSVGTSDIASFNGPTFIENILSRVTGGLRSDIDGTLRATIDGANLFLLNPAGVLFGPNATLDLSGSFHVSTADFLRFQDGAEFHADLGRESVLTVAPVEAFGFLNENPAGITINRSRLEVSEAETLSVVGGDVLITDGNLAAPTGQVNVVSVGSPGDVPLNATDLNVSSFQELMEVNITEGTVSGKKVVIRGGRFELENATVQAASSGGGHLDISVREDIHVGPTATLSASGLQGGTVHLESERGTTWVLGNVEALGRAGPGGTVHLLGERVGLLGQALVDVSGEVGGGTALIGGDYKGTGTVKNSARTFVGPEATIRADAHTQGDGGTVIIWADEGTRFEGNISAKGGVQGGNGGLAEVSGKKNLVFLGVVDLRTPNGQAGTLLLDPDDLELTSEGQDDLRGTCVSGGSCETDAEIDGQVFGFDETTGAEPSKISPAAVVNALATGDVDLQAKNTISVKSDIVSTSDQSLTLDAGKSIELGTKGFPGRGRIEVGGDLTLRAEDTINLIKTLHPHGNLSLWAGNNITIGGTSGIFSESNMALTAENNITSSAFIESSLEGNIALTANIINIFDGQIRSSGDLTLKAGSKIDLAEVNLFGENIYFMGMNEKAVVSIDGSKNTEVTAISSTATNNITFSDLSELTVTNYNVIAEKNLTVQNVKKIHINGAVGRFSGSPNVTTQFREGVFNAGKKIMIGNEDTVTEELTLNGGVIGRLDLPIRDDITVINPTQIPEQITLENIRTLTNNGAISTTSQGEEDAGNILLRNVKTLTVGQPVPDPSATPDGTGIIDSRAQGPEDNAGNGGTITFARDGGTITFDHVESILVNPGSGISTSTSFGTGAAGMIDFKQVGTLTVDGGQINSRTLAGGLGGAITGTLDTLVLKNGGIVRTTTQSTEPAAGIIDLQARTIVLTGESQIASQSEPPPVNTKDPDSPPSPDPIELGPAGTVKLTSDNIFLTGESQIIATSASNGAAGVITLMVGNLDLQGGSEISSSSSGVNTPEGLPDGKAGTITIQGLTSPADTVTLENAIISTTIAGGQPTTEPGNIIITSKTVSLTETTVSAQSTGLADAGGITVVATDTIGLNDATIKTSASQASGGNIKLDANEIIRLANSTIESSVQGDVTTVGGDINLDPDFIILQNSQILAKAVEGQGGNISLIASQAVLVDSFSVLDASSALGVSGSVNIQAPTKFLSGAIVPLENQPVNVATLYGGRCAAGAGGNYSTFVDSKTDSLSPAPGTFLASPLLLPSTQAVTNTSAGPPSPVVLTASIAPLVLGHAGAPTTACP